MLGVPFRLIDSLRLSFVGTFFNLVIPGAVGGDLVKAAYLARMNLPRTQAIATLLIDRVVGLVGLFYLAAIARRSAVRLARGGEESGPFRRGHGDGGQSRPASLGVHGPGEMTIFSGASRSMSSSVIWSFRTTCTSSVGSISPSRLR